MTAQRVNLFWMVNGEIIENEGHYLEIDMNLVDVDFRSFCRYKQRNVLLRLCVRIS